MTKKLSVFALLLILSACASAGNETRIDDANLDEVALAVQWGDDGRGTGFVAKPVPNATGDFRLRLEYRDPFSTSSTGVVNRCFGHWDTQSADGDTGAVGAGGYWRINCVSGLSAEGAFVMDRAGNGTGEGFDQQGHPVRLFFGQNAETPSQN